MAEPLILYPVTKASHKALKSFPDLARFFNLPPEETRSPYEVIRLLENTHYQHISDLLSFLNNWVPVSGCIGKRLLKCKDPFSLQQSIAELSLFTHLVQRFGVSKVVACRRSAGPICPDIEIGLDGICIKLEVYTPVELMGYQMFERYVGAIVKYLDVARGYYLVINVGPAEQSTPYDPNYYYYPYTIPSREIVITWLLDYKKKLKRWLGSKNPLPEMHIIGPGGKIEIVLRIRKLYKNPLHRGFSLSWATRSNDTTLFFEVGTTADCAKTEWGKKIKAKLKDKQCGSSTPDSIRILMVNFVIADSGWPEFISQEPFSSRFKEIILLIAKKTNRMMRLFPLAFLVIVALGKRYGSTKLRSKKALNS